MKAKVETAFIMDGLIWSNRIPVAPSDVAQLNFNTYSFMRKIDNARLRTNAHCGNLYTFIFPTIQITFKSATGIVYSAVAEKIKFFSKRDVKATKEATAVADPVQYVVMAELSLPTAYREIEPNDNSFGHEISCTKSQTRG